MRALIADDHAVVRAGLKQILIETGEITEVDEAENGRKAVQLCRVNHYNFVVLDISMPGMNGLEALKQIKTEFRKFRYI